MYFCLFTLRLCSDSSSIYYNTLLLYTTCAVLVLAVRVLPVLVFIPCTTPRSSLVYVVADILFSLVMDMLFMMQVGVSLNCHSCTDVCVT